MEFESKLSSVRTVGNKLNKQLSQIEHIKKFYKPRKEVIKFYNDYFKMVHEAVCDPKNGKDLKILIPKQMLQRLPIAVAQVQTVNTSENLLNEIRQIICFLY